MLVGNGGGGDRKRVGGQVLVVVVIASMWGGATLVVGNDGGGDHEHAVSHTKHVWYSEHGTYYRFEFILEQAMSATHVAVILCMRTGPAYEEESMKTDYPDVRNEYGML